LYLKLKIIFGGSPEGRFVQKSKSDPVRRTAPDPSIPLKKMFPFSVLLLKGYNFEFDLVRLQRVTNASIPALATGRAMVRSRNSFVSILLSQRAKISFVPDNAIGSDRKTSHCDLLETPHKNNI
jgi:hypothetical protein